MRCAETAAEELASSDSDNEEEKDAETKSMAALKVKEEEIEKTLREDAGICAYLLREYGPKSELASLKIYESIRMPGDGSNRMSFNAAAAYVQRFDAAREWCQNFGIPKKKLAAVFLSGIQPP